MAFDFDNTLVHSEQLKRAAFFDVVDSTHRAVLNRLLEVRPPLDRFELFNQLAAMCGADPTAATEWATRYSDYVQVGIASCPDVLGAGDAVRELTRSGRYVVIVSDTPQSALRTAVAERRWAGQIDEILGHPVSKPDHLQRIIDERGLASSELVMVGDRASDLAAAVRVGAAFVQVVADNSVEAADRPDRGEAQVTWPVVNDLRGLGVLIERLGTT